LSEKGGKGVVVGRDRNEGGSYTHSIQSEASTELGHRGIKAEERC